MKLQAFRPVCLLVLVALMAVQCAAPPTAAPAAPAAQPTAAPAPTTAPAQPVAAKPATEKVFKLGVQGPFTGPAARTGQEFKCSFQMAFDKIGNKIDPYKIELVWMDGQSDPEKATRSYEEAIVKDGIGASIANWHSSEAVALMDISAKYKIPHFFSYGATDVVNQKFASDPAKYNYWNFKMWPVPTKLTVNYVTALDDAIAAGKWTPKEKTLVIFGEDTDWGRSFAKGLRENFTKTGWKVIDEQYFPLEQTDFYPLLNKFKDESPAVVAGVATAPPAISAIVKQADEIGLKSLLIADALGWVGEWYNLTGKSSNYVLDQIPSWATEKGKAFAKEFKDRCGIDPSPSAGGLTYDAANLFIKLAQATIAKYGELTKETLYKFGQEEMQTGKFTYKDGIVMQEYKWTPETVPDPIVGKGYYTFPVIQYMDGKGNVIWPDEWKEADLKIKP